MPSDPSVHFASPPLTHHSSLLLFATILGDDRLRDLFRNLFVSIEFHAVGRPALRARPKVRGIAEHFHQRYGGLNRLRAGPDFHALHFATTAVQVADDIAHELLRNE